MIDLIVFSVGENRYAMNIENVQRIIQSRALTSIPNAHEYIDGMMSYEDSVIKVLNFRKIIDMDSYEKELTSLFITLKEGHVEWVDSLNVSLQTGTKFQKTLDPHACGLGKWIDSFTAYDDNIIEILNELSDFHKQLHLTGALALEEYAQDKESALEMYNTTVLDIYANTLRVLDTFVAELDSISDSLQKLIIYDNNGVLFAIKVDVIEDIAHVEESEFINSNEEHKSSDFLELDGVLDLKDVLINIIKTVKIPS